MELYLRVSDLKQKIIPQAVHFTGVENPRVSSTDFSLFLES